MSSEAVIVDQASKGITKVKWGVGVLTWKISVSVRRDMRAFYPTHTHSPSLPHMPTWGKAVCEHSKKEPSAQQEGSPPRKPDWPELWPGLLPPDLSKFISVFLGTQSMAVHLHFLQLAWYRLYIWRLLTFLLAILIQICRWYQSNGRKQRTKEPLDEDERGEWKSWLETRHSENPRSWHPGPSFHGKQGKKQKQWQILFSWAPKSLWTVTAAVKLKDVCSLEG